MIVFFIISQLMRLSRQVWFLNLKPTQIQFREHMVAQAQHLETNPELSGGVWQKHMRPSVCLQGGLCHTDEEETFDHVCCQGLWQPAAVRCDRQ